MVDNDTRNNLIIVVVLVATAILIAAFITIFSNSILDVARHGEETVNSIGKSVSGNISKSADINQLNLLQFNKSMTDVIASNDRIVHSNQQALQNLSGIVSNFSKYNAQYLLYVGNNTAANKQTLQDVLHELQLQTQFMQNNLTTQTK
jgi:predicted PurR-regulated permease PerM